MLRLRNCYLILFVSFVCDAYLCHYELHNIQSGIIFGVVNLIVGFFIWHNTSKIEHLAIKGIILNYSLYSKRHTLVLSIPARWAYMTNRNISIFIMLTSIVSLLNDIF